MAGNPARTAGLELGRPPITDTIRREREALELRRAGVPYDLIAERLGYTHRSAARKAVERGLTRTLREPADRRRLVGPGRRQDAGVRCRCRRRTRTPTGPVSRVATT